MQQTRKIKRMDFRPQSGTWQEPQQVFDPGPSRTSQAVALLRASFSRPCSPTGDPDAQRALCADLTFTPPERLRPSIEARTIFMDRQVVTAIESGVKQIVVCGAGLDDRALRFRTAGVSFFELDHPITQSDKARRLAGLPVGGDGPKLAACDFRSDSVGGVLVASGHVAQNPTLFLCEGLLVYLDRDICHRLLADLASVASADSTLAASLATHTSQATADEVTAAANARRRTGRSEAWRTILTADEHLAMLSDAGWLVYQVAESPSAMENVSHGRRSLLVAARPASRPSPTRA